MRVIAGRLKGRLLTAPQGRLVRPTADRARETLFNILAHGRFSDFALEGAVVLDAFAGAGTLGFEALSRGAARLHFLDSDRAAVKAVEANASRLGVEDAIETHAADATKPPAAPEPCDFALLDPPYESGLAAPALVALDRMRWLKPKALAVIELGAKEAFAPPAGFAIVHERAVGAARFVFLEKAGR
ncbi:MAG: 16S rRNA (guanine(966)-N(2))-methyltransferase RsmD [Rhodospirillales bacterium]|nr:16S rRNA (guanine(966)-N(2))-methyltransferase RsmD [Rhodospirillales bacterium]